MNIPESISPRSVRATYSALYALAATVPSDGIGVGHLSNTLLKHLDPDTFEGLVMELEKRKILLVTGMGRGETLRLARGPEYADGMERLRLASEGLKGV